MRSFRFSVSQRNLFPCWCLLSFKDKFLILNLGPAHTGTISYRSTLVCSKKWYGEGLRSHGYGKNQAVRSKTGPEIGRYGKSEPEIGTILCRTVPFSCEQQNRSSLGPLSGPVWFLWVTPSWFLWVTPSWFLWVTPSWFL